MDENGKPNYQTTIGMIEHVKQFNEDLATKMKLVFEKCSSPGNNKPSYSIWLEFQIYCDLNLA